MDVSRNHLVADINSVAPEDRARYSQIPKHLAEYARDALDGRQECYVNPNRETALTQWAAKKRQKQRARTKLAKASRKRNRAS